MCRLVVLDYDSLAANALAILDRIAELQPRPLVLVVTATRAKEDLIELLSHESFTNLIAKNVEINASELVVTVQKIISNDVFGLEKYLSWGLRRWSGSSTPRRRRGPPSTR